MNPIRTYPITPSGFIAFGVAVAVAAAAQTAAIMSVLL